MPHSVEAHILLEILAQAPDHIVFCDADHKIRYVNRVTAGFEMDKLIGADMFTVLPPQEHETVRRTLQRVAETGEEQSLECVIPTPDGTEGWYLQRYSALRDKDGELLGYINVVTDRTAQKLAEQARDRALEDSRVASWMAGHAEMARTIIHNVGNVLNSARVTASIIERALQTSRLPQLGKAVQMLLDNAPTLQTFLETDTKGKRLLAYLPRLVDELQAHQDDLRDEARRLQESLCHIANVMQSQKDVTSRAGVLEQGDLAEVARTAIQLSTLGTQLAEARIEHAYADLPPLLMDRHLVLQILINLLQNAADAIRAVPAGERHVRVQTAVLGDSVEVSVWNAGEPIAPDVQARIFEAGFSTKASGSGLGLHTSANAALSMGGFLEHRPTPEGGALFVLGLPRSGCAATSVPVRDMAS